jgi:hypothetical protein
MLKRRAAEKERIFMMTLLHHVDCDGIFQLCRVNGFVV